MGAFILVVLQAVANGPYGVSYGWVPMGGFVTREACVAAGDALKRGAREARSVSARVEAAECLPTGAK